MEVVNRAVLEKVPFFNGADPLFLHNLALMLRSAVVPAGEPIVKEGDTTGEMYFIARGQAEAVNSSGKVLSAISEGGFFGELSLLLGKPRSATVRAVTQCNLFVLEQGDFEKVLRDYPEVRASLEENARARYAQSPK